MNEINVQLSSKCSLNCKYCTHGIVSVGGNGDMEPWLRENLQKTIINGNIQTVTLGFFGETTILPWWTEWTIPLLNAGKNLKIATNASLPFTEETINTLARFQEVIISIDSPKEETMYREEQM